jgi:hypothetical protein
MNNIENIFVPYQIALDMRSIGFDEPCLASWIYKTKERIPTLYGCGALLFKTDGLITNQTEDIICSAPTFSQAFRWFRENGYYHQIEIRSGKHPLKAKYTFSIYGKDFYDEYPKEYAWIDDFPVFKTYEEAEFECIKELIKIVK